MILPILRRGAAELGLNLSERQFEQFEEYYRLLVEWNAKFNLTSRTGYDDVQTIHFLDSLSLVRSGIEFDDKRFIDVGAGAGFPGLPLKIAFPEIQLTLLEATGKKTVFLTEVVAALGLKDVIVLNLRAEDAARKPDQREKYDIAVSRAVASLDTLCELCLPFCRVGGSFIAMKKGDTTAEIKAANKGITILGGRLRVIEMINLTDLADARQLVVIDKIKRTPQEYPRRSGLPAQKPLS